MQDLENCLPWIVCRSLLLANTHKFLNRPPQRVVGAKLSDLLRFDVGPRPALNLLPRHE